MDPYTEYLGMGTVVGRNEPSYRIPQPRAERKRVRNNRWRLRALQR